jgi:hypothetical protein
MYDVNVLCVGMYSTVVDVLCRMPVEVDGYSSCTVRRIVERRVVQGTVWCRSKKCPTCPNNFLKRLSPEISRSHQSGLYGWFYSNSNREPF